MLSEELAGYKGHALKILQEAGVGIGDLIRIIKNGEVYEGSLMPRYELAEAGYIVVKLKSGYNIGVKVTPSMKIERIKGGVKPSFIPPPSPGIRLKLPKVSILSTGGTICSRVDYRTGGVYPALSASDLYGVVPELSEVAIIEAEILFSLFSENITPRHWSEIAKAVAKHIENGVAGVVVAHGTDTMAYTAAALSFALQNLPAPVIFVGAQRSSDRPSSDAASNLIGAVAIASRAPFAEVVLAMHEGLSDEFIAIHRGTKVRKCHTSRRDAFKSINSPPLARYDVKDGSIRMLMEGYGRRDPAKKLILKPSFNDEVALVKFYPSMSPEVINFFIDKGYRGIVLEGTGLGHVSQLCYEPIKRGVEEGLVIAMTSQCLWGRVNMNVYYTGRDLLALGVIPLEDMLPETALVKMMWALGQTREPEEVKKIMLTNISWEASPRRPLKGDGA